MQWIRNILRETLWLVSEIEAHFAKPNSPLHLRRAFLRRSGVTFKKHLWVGRGLHLYKGHALKLGERCALGDFVRITDHALIDIGDDFTGASGLHIDSGTHNPDTLQPSAVPIKIGSRVWCGINVTITAGVTIGDDVVIGAGAVVVKDIPSKSLAVGVPARVARSLNRDETTPLWTWVE